MQIEGKIMGHGTIKTETQVLSFSTESSSQHAMKLCAGAACVFNDFL
jgi:hypothetical protein